MNVMIDKPDPTNDKVQITLTRTEAEHLKAILIGQIQWTEDANGQTAYEIHQALDAAGVAYNYNGPKKPKIRAR